MAARSTPPGARSPATPAVPSPMRAGYPRARGARFGSAVARSPSPVDGVAHDFNKQRVVARLLKVIGVAGVLMGPRRCPNRGDSRRPCGTASLAELDRSGARRRDRCRRAAGGPRLRACREPPYTAAWILVCKAGRPLGSIEIPLRDPVIAVAELEREVRRQLGDDWRQDGPVAHQPPPLPLSRASVVVPTNFARPAELRRCLKTLAELDHPDYEVIVVDNRPADAPAAESRECGWCGSRGPASRPRGTGGWRSRPARSSPSPTTTCRFIPAGCRPSAAASRASRMSPPSPAWWCRSSWKRRRRSSSSSPAAARTAVTRR